MNKAGNVLKKAKEELEVELQRLVVSSENYIELTNPDELIETK